MRSLAKLQVLLFGLCGLAALSHANEAAKITRFHVNTNIHMRYAMTKVEMQVKNLASDTSEVFFDMYIPKEAFVSNFSMVVKGQTYVAKVETKEEAKMIYDSSSTSSGLLQSQDEPEFKDGKQITFSAKVDPQDKVVFHLDYEELLQRKNGQYQYELNIQPKDEVIKDLEINIDISESLPLKDVSVQKVKSRGEITSRAESLTSETLIFDPNNEPHHANISYNLPIQNQVKDWKMVVNYDVDRPDDGSDVQIAGGRFVHYFAPDNLPTIPKHVTFVIDVSGSMDGDKLTQTKDAMTMILENMNDIDSLNILTFSDEVYHFEADGAAEDKLSWAIDKNGILEPMQYCLNMKTIGGTNINDAMLAALDTARQVKQREEISSRTQQMIIFLTDGQATTGETNNGQIKRNVRRANNDNIPIYALAFGNGADFTLISEISEENHGFARRIYESGNSFEQLEDFYKEISDPKLKNVKFQYIANGNVTLEPANLTKTDVEFAYGKNEYAIVGDFGEEINEIEIVIQADDNEDSDTPIEIDRILIPTCRPEGPTALPAAVQGVVHGCIPFPNPTIPVSMPTWQQTETEAFMERLWAFKRIKYLLNDKEDCRAALRDSDDDLEVRETTTEVVFDYVDEEESNEEEEIKEENVCQNEAVNLAKKYNFVTDVTSMVVESNDDYINNGTIDLPRPIAPPEYEDYSQSINSNKRYTSLYAYGAPAAPPRRTPLLGLGNKTAMRTSGRRPAPAARPGLRRKKTTTSTRRRTTTTTNNLMYYSRNQDYDNYGLEQSAMGASLQPLSNSPSGSPCASGNLKLWSQTYLRGDSVMLRQDTTNLSDVNFDDNLGSLEIRGVCCWILYTEPYFSGQSMTLSAGKYESSTQLVDVFKTASSAKSVVC